MFGALLAALFVLPLKSWFRQRDDLAERRRELAVLDGGQRRSSPPRSTTCRPPMGSRRRPAPRSATATLGEKRLTVMPAPDAPIALPAGWPYDGVTQIVAVRTAAATPATTIAPPTTATVVAESTVAPETTVDPSVTVPPTAAPEAVPDATTPLTPNPDGRQRASSATMPSRSSSS